MAKLWVHKFVHKLGALPNTWYVHEDTRRQTKDWSSLRSRFCATISPGLLLISVAETEAFPVLFRAKSSRVLNPCDEHKPLLTD